MFSIIFKLSKIMASGSSIFTQLTSNIKKGPKGIIKTVLLALLALYLICVLCGMYIVFMVNTYKILSAAGNTHFMPLISMVMATFVILFFGFTSVAASYYTGTTEEFLITLPLTPAHFFGAKFLLAFVSEAVFALGMFIIGSAVYGYYEKLLTKPMFYLGTIFCGLSFSVTAVFLIYFIFIVILYFIPALRKRKLLSGLATVCVILFASGYSLINSLMSSMMNSTPQAVEKVSSAIGKLTEVGQSIGPLIYFSKALDGKVLPILILAAISALVIFVFVPLAGKMYIKTLNGFSDVKTKKMSAEKAEEVIEKDVRSFSIFHALFVRDVRNVVREPAFFSNGPLFTFLFPVIFIISFVIGFMASGQNISELINAVQLKLMELSPESLQKIRYFAAIGFMAYIVFTGTFANIATTSFSREGKSLNDLKAMPIRNNVIIKVKFWHAMLYIGLSALVAINLLVAAVMLLGLPFSFFETFETCLMMTIAASAISVLLIFIDMFLDTMNPKLQWESPIAATKQNFNVLWSILLTIVVCGIVIVLLVFLLPKKLFSLIILAAVITLISAPVGAAYFKYAEKRIDAM